MVAPIEARCLGAGGIVEEGPPFSDSDVSVHAVGPVELVRPRRRAGGNLVDEDGAEPATGTHLPGHAQDGEVVRRSHVLHLVGLHVEDTQVETIQLSGEAGAAENGNLDPAGIDADAAAEEEFGLAGTSHLEITGILQEEGSLLGEEQIEAGEIDLLFVHFHLGEIGVQGRVQRQSRRQRVFHVHAGIQDPVLERFGSPVIVEEPALDVRNDLAAGSKIQIQAGQVSGQGDAMELEFPGHGSPERLFVLPSEISFEVDPPGAVGSGFVAQAPEGNRELRFPTAGSDPGLDRPDRIPIQVEGRRLSPLSSAEAAAAHGSGSGRSPSGLALAAADDLGVEFDTSRRRRENISVLVIVVRVQEHLERIGLGQDPVAPGLRGDDVLRTGIEADDADEEGVAVESDPHLNPFGGRGFRFGELLHETGRRRHGHPGGFHHAVQDRRFRHAVGPHAGFAGSGFQKPQASLHEHQEKEQTGKDSRRERMRRMVHAISRRPRTLHHEEVSRLPVAPSGLHPASARYHRPNCRD